MRAAPLRRAGRAATGLRREDGLAGRILSRAPAAGIDNDIKIWEPRAQDEAPLPNTAEADRLWDERHEERMEALRLCGRNLNRRFRTHRHESPFFSLFGGYYGSV